ncbi:MAG: hypothetical protein P8Y71_30210 [Pseudolabrys sp.]
MEAAFKLRIILKQFENSQRRCGAENAGGTGTRLAKLRLEPGQVSRIEIGGVMRNVERTAAEVPGEAGPQAASWRRLKRRPRDRPWRITARRPSWPISQTRARRRVAPAEAIAAYRAAARLIL